MLLSEEAVSGLIDGPRHVVLAPMVGIFSHFLLVLVTFFWRFLLPHLVTLFLTTKVCVLLLLLLLALVIVFIVLFGSGAELWVQLEQALQGIERISHCHNLLIVGGFGTPDTLGFKPIILHLAVVMRAFCMMDVSLQLR